MDEMQRYDFIYDSMLTVIYQEYCELVVSFIPSDKINAIQEIGRNRTHTQKKRAKEYMIKKPKAQRISHVDGCFIELRIQLLRQLYRILGDDETTQEGKDYAKSVKFLTDVVDKEREVIKAKILALNEEE